jgi:hypothetical protein
VVVVEGAYAHEAVCTGALQRQELLNHKRNVRLRLELLNNIIRVKGHAPKIAIICHPRAGGDLFAYDVCCDDNLTRSHNLENVKVAVKWGKKVSISPPEINLCVLKRIFFLSRRVLTAVKWGRKCEFHRQ